MLKRCDAVKTHGEWQEVEPREFRLCLSDIGKQLAAPDPEWLTPIQVANVTGRSKDTVLAAIRSKRLPANNTGSLAAPRFMVHRDSIHDWKPKD